MILLSIAIPTFNRANKLDKQLECLANWKGDLASITIRVHDNASTDETSSILEKWRTKLGSRLTSHRHDKNLGLVGNYLSCIETCKTTHVWVMGDDDVIHEAGANAVLREVIQHPETGIFALNYCPISGTSGLILKKAALPEDMNERFPDGRDFVEACQRFEFGSLMFITAVVLHAETAREIIEASPIPTTNLVLPFYIPAAISARKGGRLVKEIVFDGFYGVGSWKKQEFQVFYLQMPLVLEQLILRYGMGKGLLDQYLARYAIKLFKPGRRMVKTPLLWLKAVKMALRILKLQRSLP